MSVGILRESSIGNILRTLGSPSLRDGHDVVEVNNVFGVSNMSMRTPDGLDRFHNEVEQFVKHGYLFNAEAYRMRYDTEEWSVDLSGDFVKRVERQGKVVSLAQLFMTLNCLTYNADVRDYMTQDEYENYLYHEAFEKWMKQAKELTAMVAECIARRQAHEENCEWF